MSGHLLKTINPEAAAEADSGWKPLPEAVDWTPNEMAAANSYQGVPIREVESLPLPSVGMDVVYHVRDGDARNMRTKFPAVILSADPETRTVSLVITVDAGDLWRQDHVPQYAPPEAGWDWIEGSRPWVMAGDSTTEIDHRPASIRWMKDGGEDEGPKYDAVKFLQQRLEEAMSAIVRLTSRIEAIEAKRGPGRPAKPKEK